MKKALFTTCWLLGILCLLACTSTKPAPSTSVPPLLPQKEQVWQLVAMRGKMLALSGRASCNTYGADCRLNLVEQRPQGDLYSITIDGIDSGRTLCPEADMNAEARYLALLQKADALLIDAYAITLLQKDKEILRFELQ